MRNATERRRHRFLKALAQREMTQSAWAAEQGVTKGHLSLVLAGKRDSLTLTAKIDAFTAETLGKQAEKHDAATVAA